LHCKGNNETNKYHKSGSTLRRFTSGWKSLSDSGSASADRLSGTAVGTFGFFLTRTPFSDFLISFFARVLLPFKSSEAAFMRLEVGAAVDNTSGGGLLTAFSRAATAL
jgi:hypothetical protein